MGFVDLTGFPIIGGPLFGAFYGMCRLAGLSSGSTRGIAPPAFALASPGRVRAMRGRRREGLRITILGNGTGRFRDARTAISAPTPSKLAPGTCVPNPRPVRLEPLLTVPFPFISLWGTGTALHRQSTQALPTIGRAA